jgi:CRP/FNR family transcriptional regulator, cyclic AMP receptor protein
MTVPVLRDPVDILAGTALLEGVPRSDLEALARQLKARSYAKGSYIFQEGDPGHMLFIVASGQVKIAHLGRGGEEVVYALLLPGDTFGELALFEDGAVRSADAQATEATECLTLAREPFVTFLDQHPAAIRHVIKLVSRYIRSSDESFSEAAFLDIPGRVAKKLLDLAESQGDPSLEGRRIRVRLTQRTLAGLVGASRENVNRALSRFVAHGDISQEHGFITILRPEQLRKRA